jgi:hypothetical protein
LSAEGFFKTLKRERWRNLRAGARKPMYGRRYLSALRYTQGIGVYFFGVKISLDAAYFEEKIHHKVEKVEEERENEALFRKISGLHGLAVKISSKIW